MRKLGKLDRRETSKRVGREIGVTLLAPASSHADVALVADSRIFIGGHKLVQIFPADVVINVIGLLFMGRLLELTLGSRESVRFIFIVNFLTSLCLFVTTITFYYITTYEKYL